MAPAMPSADQHHAEASSVHSRDRVLRRNDDHPGEIRRDGQQQHERKRAAARQKSF
jgi:hypothetical protein